MSSFERIPGDEFWDIDQMGRNEDGSWDVLIRAKVRIEDETGAVAELMQAGSPEVPLPSIDQAVQRSVKQALVDGRPGVRFLEASIATGLDSFTRTNEN